MKRNIITILFASALFLTQTHRAIGGNSTVATPEQMVNKLILNTNFPACKGVALLDQPEYEKNKEYWDQVMQKCGVGVEVLPFTNFLNTMIYKLSNNANDYENAADFLTQVGNASLAQIEGNRKKYEVLAHCERKDEAWFKDQAALAPTALKPLYDYSKCGELDKNIRKSMADTRPVLRQDLALTRYNNVGVPYPGYENPDPKKNVNSDMEGAAFVVSPKMEPLSDSELNAAARAFADESQKIVQNYQTNMAPLKKQIEDYKAQLKKDGTADRDIPARVRVNFPPELLASVGYNTDGKYDDERARNSENYLNFLSSQRSAMQRANQVKYMTDLGNAPILAYLDVCNKPNNSGNVFQRIATGVQNFANTCSGLRNQSFNPSPDQIAAAADHLVTDAKAQLDKIQKILADTKGNYKPKLLELMKYGPIVNQVLSKDPKNCSVATELANYITQRDLRNNIEIGVGMVGLGVVIGVAAGPAAASLGAPAAVQASVTAGSMAAYAAATSVAWLPSSYRDIGNSEQGVLMGVLDPATYEAAKKNFLLNVALAPLGMIGGGGAGRGVRAIEEASPEFMTALERVSSKAEARTLIANLKAAETAGNAQAVDTALTAISKKLGTENELNLVKKIVEKGFAPNGDAKYAQQILSSLSQLPKEARVGVIKRMQDTMALINPAKLNEFNRAQAIDVMLSASEFGIDNPALIAEHVNNWSEGLPGITKAYKLATEKMSQAKYLKITDIEQRRQAAFGDTLDDLMKDNPQFPTEADRAAAKKNMLGCGGFGAG